MKKFSKMISGKRIFGVLCSVLMIVCLLTAAAGCGAEPTASQPTAELTVQILDVGQGSAALIRQGDSFLLMDGGDRDYSSYVVSYLKKESVEQLDYVIVSHYDADHLNGVVGVLNAFECKQVLAPDYKTDTKVYQSYLKVINEKNIPVEHPGLGDTYTFADSSFLQLSGRQFQLIGDSPVLWR